MEEKERRIVLGLSYVNKHDYNEVVKFAKDHGLTLSQAGKILVNRGLINPGNQVLTQVNTKNKPGGGKGLFLLGLIFLIGTAIYFVIEMKNESRAPGKKFNIWEFFAGKSEEAKT